MNHNDPFETSRFNRPPLNPISLTNSTPCHEKSLKVDKRILEIMRSGGNDTFPSAAVFFQKIIDKTRVNVDFSSFKDRQGNEIPIVKVKSDNLKNLEAASALIMEYLDPHRDKMTFNIDVSHNDHSYIIGKDGSRIKQLSRETGCHIHLPDCNKTSGKKSNKISIAGTTFNSIEQARNQIRKSLPLNIGFKATIKSRKFVHIDTSCSEVQAIKRKYRVDVTFTNVNSTHQFAEVTINVKGGRFQLDEIKSATSELYYFVTGEDISSHMPDFTISIDISHSHHQYVKGKNNCNLKVINQRSNAQILFPSNDEVNQVLIQGKNLTHTVLGWQELMGYLPLLLSFDVNFDIHDMKDEIHKLEKQFGVGIRIREKLCGHVYTVLIKTQERHSICLQEIRQKILEIKIKSDKSNENFMKDTSAYFSNCLYENYQNFQTMLSGYSNLEVSKCFSPFFHAIDPANYALKYPRFPSLQPADIPLSYMAPIITSDHNNYKHKGMNKRSPVNEHNYSNVFSSPDFVKNEYDDVFISNHSKSNLTSLTTCPMSVKGSFDASADANVLNMPLKPRKLGFSTPTASFDLISPETTYPFKSDYSPNSTKDVDYSFSRFCYHNETDSGIDSIFHPELSTSSSTSNQTDVTYAESNQAISSPPSLSAKPCSPNFSLRSNHI